MNAMLYVLWSLQSKVVWPLVMNRNIGIYKELYINNIPYLVYLSSFRIASKYST